MKESQLQIPLICGRTKHLMRCGMFIPFLHRHLEIFSSGGVFVCVCVCVCVCLRMCTSSVLSDSLRPHGL